MAITDSMVLWACVDCYSFAHGVLDADAHPDALARCTDALARIKRDNAPYGAWLVPEGTDHTEWCGFMESEDSCNGECQEGGFSWSSCEVCLSPLGGDRHAVTLMLSDTRAPAEALS